MPRLPLICLSTYSFLHCTESDICSADLAAKLSDWSSLLKSSLDGATTPLSYMLDQVRLIYSIIHVWLAGLFWNYWCTVWILHVLNLIFPLLCVQKKGHRVCFVVRVVLRENVYSFECTFTKLNDRRISVTHPRYALSSRPSRSIESWMPSATNKDGRRSNVNNNCDVPSWIFSTFRIRDKVPERSTLIFGDILISIKHSRRNPVRRNQLNLYSRFDAVPACDRQTDRQAIWARCVTFAGLPFGH